MQSISEMFLLLSYVKISIYSTDNRNLIAFISWINHLSWIIFSSILLIILNTDYANLYQILSVAKDVSLISDESV